MSRTLDIRARTIAVAIAISLAALAWAGIASAAPAEARQVPKGLMGVASPGYPSAGLFKRVHRSRASIVRLQLPWSVVEYAPGARYWDPIDEVIGRASVSRTPILALIYGTPAWAAKNQARAPIYTAEQRTGYRAFLRDLVGRYGPSGVFWTEHPELPRNPIRSWQIGNEVNLPGFWGGRASPKGYARLLKLAATSIRAVHARARIVTSGLFVAQTVKGSVSMENYLTRLYRVRNVRRYFDAVAIHPYSPHPGGVLDWMRLARSVMDGAGDRATPLWVTEFGWTTAGRLFRSSPYRATLAQQRKRLRRTYILLGREAKTLRLRKALWFSLSDVTASDNFWTHHLGLFRANGSAKPAWKAFARLAGGRP